MRLIDADKIPYTEWIIKTEDGETLRGNLVYKSEIDRMPAEKPERNNSWIMYKSVSGDTKIRCPKCGRSERYVDGRHWKYCPSCGEQLLEW